MTPIFLISALAAGAFLLLGRGVVRRKSLHAAATASGLVPVADLSHIPPALQQTALWNLADGGFERRVVHGVLARGTTDIDVTAFDMETLRDRRGEWAWLPVDVPFRIGGVVSVVVCQLDRVFPHVLLKRAGHGDNLHEDIGVERAGTIAKIAREGLRLPGNYPAEMPNLPTTRLDVELPDGWRAYSGARDLVAALLSGGLATALSIAGRRDLVIELIDSLVVVYPAALDVTGADAFADLTATALKIVDGVLAASPELTPRGVADARPA